MKRIIFSAFIIYTVVMLFILHEAYRLGVVQGETNASEQQLKETCIHGYYQGYEPVGWCLKYIESLPKK